jgi:hypothetical protein
MEFEKEVVEGEKRSKINCILSDSGKSISQVEEMQDANILQPVVERRSSNC